MGIVPVHQIGMRAFDRDPIRPGHMASGHANRASRPNTWLHRPATRRKVLTCHPEPSTHGRFWHSACPLSGVKRTSLIRSLMCANDPQRKFERRLFQQVLVTEHIPCALWALGIPSFEATASMGVAGMRSPDAAMRDCDSLLVSQKYRVHGSSDHQHNGGGMILLHS
jgi:hypothetical protein